MALTAVKPLDDSRGKWNSESVLGNRCHFADPRIQLMWILRGEECGARGDFISGTETLRHRGEESVDGPAPWRPGDREKRNRAGTQ
ncbi:hypothetical protein NDU88_002415 [Pleurodeles waltl]|uniref:Uncharacterized protein n=1 Tax=Pleurodeles waltl TaxID=8319 RepID=A0AAV7M0H2_PLEWA|nr:hypothetical protein NDU88_002415 [Pleurodeles waltl]